MAPSADDKVVGLPGGAELDAASVYRSTTGTNDGGILWDGDEPYFSYAEGRSCPRRIGSGLRWGCRPNRAADRGLQNQVAKLRQQLEERG